MGLSHAPRVITDGLVLGLDAANTRSYGGSGTTWTDLIGSNNGTLTNGPVFTQEPKLEPFGGAGAVEFDGTGDYLSIPDSTDLDFGSGDFTIECWVYPDSGSTNGAFITKRSSTAYFAPFLLRQINTTSLAVLMSTSGSSWNFNQTATSALTTDAWQHVAVTRSGTAIKAFVNGTEVISSTLSGALMTNTQIAVIGTDFAYDLDGKISNLRVIKGTALYTSNFTPPRKKLEVTSDTVLLTCEKGIIKDRSSSAHAITVTGDAHSITGASYFEFDGSNDYVTIPDSDDFTFGSQDFTIDAWIYPTATGSYPSFISKYAGSSTNSTFFFSLGNSNQTLEFYLYNGVGGQQAVLQSGTVSLNAWNYVAAVRVGNRVATYLNGVEVASTTWTYSVYDANVSVTVGSGQYNGAFYFNGRISNTRIYKGKGLTAAEVEQNFNALRGRYGI